MSLYLEKIGGTYYFRLRVPKDLLPVLGVKQIRKTLRTQNYASAKSLSRSILFETEKLFFAIRSNMLTQEQLRELIERYKTNYLNNMTTARRGGGHRVFLPSEVKLKIHREELALTPLETSNEIIRSMEADRERFNLCIQTNDFEDTKDLARALLKKQGIEPALTDSEMNLLCEYILKARIDICNVMIERMRGNFNNAFDANPHTVSQPSPSRHTAKSLSELFETYKQVKQAKGWAQTTLEKNEAAFSTIIDILGDVPLTEFKNEVVPLHLLGSLKTYPRNKGKIKQFMDRRYSPSMAKEPGFVPLGEETVRFTMGLLSSLLRYAINNPEKWGIGVNLAEGLISRDRRKPSDIRSEYTKVDLEGLFRELRKIRTAVEPEKFWIPLIALYSGARLNEICQLRTEDIAEDEGIPIIHIRHDLSVQQQTKSKENRSLPIHPTLIDLGFLKYVENVKSQRHERLWTNLREYKGKWEKDMSKWYNRTLKPKFTSDDRKVFHSFRHSFINWFKQNALNDSNSLENLSVMKSIVGHLENADRGILEKVGGVSLDRYGKAYPTTAQLKLLQQLDYGVELTILRR